MFFQSEEHAVVQFVVPAWKPLVLSVGQQLQSTLVGDASTSWFCLTTLHVHANVEIVLSKSKASANAYC